MNDWMNRLERAKSLYDAGALTEAEFEAEKARLLPRGSQRPTGQMPLLESEAASGSEMAIRNGTSWRSRLYKASAPVIGIVLVGSAFYFWQRTSESQADVGPVVRKETERPAAANGVSASPAPPPSVAQVKPDDTSIRASCKSGELKVLLPGVGNTGSIVLNYPLDDTDGMGSLRMNASSSICLTQAQLALFAVPGSTSETSSDVLVTFDPAGGKPNPLDYSVLFCSELPDTPQPPKSWKIGKFRWRGQRVDPEVTVSWYANYRKQIESDCACEDGSTAPCKEEQPSA